MKRYIALLRGINVGGKNKLVAKDCQLKSGRPYYYQNSQHGKKNS